MKSSVYVSNLPECPLSAFISVGLDEEFFEDASPQGMRFYVPDWYKGRIAREGVSNDIALSATYSDGEQIKRNSKIYFDRLTDSDKSKIQSYLFKLLAYRAYERIRSQYGLWIDFIYANFKTEIHDKHSYKYNIAKAIYCLISHFMRAVSENQYQSFTLQLGSTNMSTPIDFDGTRYWTVETLSYIASSGLDGLIHEFRQRDAFNNDGTSKVAIQVIELKPFTV